MITCGAQDRGTSIAGVRPACRLTAALARIEMLAAGSIQVTSWPILGRHGPTIHCCIHVD